MHSVRNNRTRSGVIFLGLLLAPFCAQAQTATDQATLAKLSAPPPPKNLNTVPAKKLFGAKKFPANLTPRAIGTYALGCLAGANTLPLDGPAWQVMRPSRHRNWGLPQLVNLLKRFAAEAKQYDGWNGLLVGDMAQPRGGPMLSGHASHQIGLDADVWFTPMPDRLLTANERENMAATIMVKNRKEINPAVWSESRMRILKRAASYPEVGRIFVHPPIKAELCKWATGDRSWLAKVRPMFGHNYHFHIRMNCPAGMKSCKNQWKPKPKDGTGCGDELAYWMSDVPWTPKKRDPKAPPYVPPPPLTLSGLPAECRAVIAAP
jgi:penicillin-insensitive murein DD-endopeptidase